MKTRINLYTEEFYPQKQRLSLGQALLTWLLFAVVVVSYGVWLQKQTQTTTEQTSQQRQLLTLQAQQLASLKQGISQQTMAPELQRELAQKQQQLQLKQILQQRFQGQTYSRRGFSATLQALASIPESQVWLTKIRIEGGTMALSGRSTSSDAVPKWLKQFQAYPDLASRQFSGLAITRDEQQQLHFSLSASAEKTPPAGGAHD